MPAGWRDIQNPVPKMVESLCLISHTRTRPTHFYILQVRTHVLCIIIVTDLKSDSLWG